VLLCYLIAASLQQYLASITTPYDDGTPRLEQESGTNLTLPKVASTMRIAGRARRLPMEMMTLDEAARSAVSSCPPGLVYIRNVVSPHRHDGSHSRAVGIPRIVHQTSKSRCVTPAFARAIEKWQFAGDWSYYFYDDEAVMRLFRQESERHHGSEEGGGDLLCLLGTVATRCASHSGTIRADLFRYLVLYRYGGVFADIDSVPTPKFTPPDAYLRMEQPQLQHGSNGSLFDGMDGLFVVEQFHLLSQYFMAVSPNHPLMWYAIHHSLINLLRAGDTGRASAAMATGPHALHAGLASFVADNGGSVEPAIRGARPVRAGTYVGTRNRTVTAIGTGENHREYVDRDVLRGQKRADYQRMAMRHFQDDKKHPSGRSCLSVILDLTFQDVG
jgi:hypothetical protein